MKNHNVFGIVGFAAFSYDDTNSLPTVKFKDENGCLILQEGKASLHDQDVMILWHLLTGGSIGGSASIDSVKITLGNDSLGQVTLTFRSINMSPVTLIFTESQVARICKAIKNEG